MGQTNKFKRTIGVSKNSIVNENEQKGGSNSCQHNLNRAKKERKEEPKTSHFFLPASRQLLAAHNFFFVVVDDVVRARKEIFPFLSASMQLFAQW